ncbi:MAG: bifunctional 3-(3-hydroxy-phenyl)propionate/3-hydroxycinnamic acid hydroxylase [Agitococcus sp.]|nr:bifunctional 3-(3-hydroxy-phenyl)propionate/3-hydroxycinnamic acid hydroxylase [Agitococcus sp.]
MSELSSLPDYVDVLVVGFGPAGAALTNLLGRYDINTLVIDKADDILPMPRAIALDNEALRILQMVGLPENAFNKVAIPQVRLNSPYVGEFGRINTVGCLDGHPKLVTFYQPDMEAALRQALRQYPHIQTLTGVEMQDFIDLGHQVQVQLALKDGSTHRVCCRYLVAADGANSAIRTRLGIDFTGETYPQDWLIVDARHVRKPITDIEFTCDSERPVPHMTAPDGRERWEFMLKPEETREQVLQPEFIRQLLKPWANPDELQIERTAVYRFHARVAKQFSKGNVFLVGDAAHITPPFVGQGLCAGLRDVANLAWKLALVIQGKADDKILASYDQERRPHAKAMIDLARVMGLLIKPVNPAAGMLSANLVKNLRRLSPVRSLIDELKIKPRNRFGQGLFIARKKEAHLDRGNHVAQVWLRDNSAKGAWSDDVLGTHFNLVGFGVDPTSYLTMRQQTAWLAVGGKFLQINPRGQQHHSANNVDIWEDLTGELLPKYAPLGWVAAIRPDHVVMHDARVEQAHQVIEKSLALLAD